MRPALRWIRRAAILLLGLLIVAAAPVFATETVCRPSGETAPAPPSVRLPDDPAWWREEATSYYSYPEWYIVHAYEDLAAVLQRSDEHAFDYLGSIGGFWRSLCGINQFAGGGEADNTDTKIMLYTIGLSFSVEMAIKGAYEETVGRLFAWWRGPDRSAEDQFAVAMAADYAAFLRQTPWYRYPFAAKLGELWAAPIDTAHPVRSIERRAALALEWGAKAGYAWVIGRASAAALGSAALRIRTVVDGADRAVLETQPDTAVVSMNSSGRAMIETPRYRAFTAILTELASAGAEIVGIAGNDDILVTVIEPPGETAAYPGARRIFAVSIQAEPGSQRVGLSVPVTELAGLIRSVVGGPLRLEHVYDY
jgi:hypothetical protein